MSNTIQGAAITPETPLQASVAQGPVIINDYVIDLQEVPEGVQLTVRKGSEEQTAVIPMGGSGGVSSWNDLTDKPFGEVYGDTLTWDGNTEGRASIGDEFYKVSDVVITASDITNGCTLSIAASNTLLGTETAEVDDSTPGLLTMIVGSYQAISVTEEFCVQNGVPGGAGIYFMVIANVYVSALTIPGYTGFPSTKKLDAKYLPGVVVLYASEDAYLYPTQDASTPDKRLTRRELQQIIQSGRQIQVMGIAMLQAGLNTRLLPAMINDYDNYMSLMVVMWGVDNDTNQGVPFALEAYTAEYTPESTASE